MKFSLSWLKEHLDTDADMQAVADCLNRIGLEVEGIENPAEALSAFRIAKVISAAPHPQADKLQVLSVDAGGAPLQVVCGAPNARAGMLGVFGPAGAIVPANGMVLKVAAIRGVESNGMMCSIAELELGDDHDGIIELPDDAPVGQVYADWAGLDDPVIDVSITPNRQDCMGVRGIARDLAAAGLGTLKPLGEVYKINLSAPLEGNDPAPNVRTDDEAGCPAFYAQSVSGVRNGEAPEWMRAKLKAIGQKPISALVDITNFLSIDLGRPLHVYDRAKLHGALVARKAKDGEEIVAVDTQTGKTDARSTRGERALLTAGVALERGDGPLIVDYVEHDGSPVDLGEGQGMVKIRSRGAALADPGSRPTPGCLRCLIHGLFEPGGRRRRIPARRPMAA